MECPKCRHDNPPHSKFCFECGARLELACPICGTNLPADVKFCNECGHDLSKLPAPSKQPAHPVPSPEPSPSPTPEGERRQATVLFSDLSGYTAMNERLDPEEVQRLMSRIKAEAVRIVEGHGGIVNQFVGDEVLALFGIPTAHEDDPVRAVRAARDLHEMVRAMSPDVEEQIGAPLRLHSGIDTGLIVTGSEDRRDGTYGITGDTVNTGARLASHAEADTVLISPETQRLIADYFQTEALEPVAFKGKAEPVTPFRVIEQTAVASRFGAALRRGFTRYVGREEELAALHNALKKAAAGRGQFVTVMGEPGIGKSRLMFEFRHGLDSEQVNVLEGRCQAYGSDTPYLPFIYALRRGLRLDEAQRVDALHDHVVSAVREINPDLEGFIPHYLHLLSIPSEAHKLPQTLQGEALRRALEEALAAIIAFTSQSKPLVMVLEDWHWADEASDAALKNLAGLVSHYPLMLAVTYRPEYERAWSTPDNYTPIVVKTLEVDDTEAMVQVVLGAEHLPDGLAERIHERTGGNALFNEEVARSLLEEGTVVVRKGAAKLAGALEELHLPDTVHAVIRARVDRLGPDAREVLRLASVIGREFPCNLLERLHPTPERLPAALETLARRDLVHQVRVVPEAAYIFKNVLTQVVVYETLLLQQRKELHAKVGQAIEALYPDRLEEHFEALAYHFENGEVWDKAMLYLVRAGIKARQSYSLKTALALFDRAKDILENRAPDVRWKVRYDLYYERSQILGEMAQWLFAYQDICKAEEIARNEGELKLRIRTMFTTAFFAFWANLHEHALAKCAELEPLVADDPANMLGVVVQQAFVLVMLDDIDAALQKEHETRELMARAPDSPHIGKAAYVIGLFSRWRGDYRKTQEMIKPMLPKQKTEAAAGIYLNSVLHYGLSLGECGRYQESIDVLSEGKEFGVKTDSLYGVIKLSNALGWAFHEICLFDKAIDYNNLSISTTEKLLGPGTVTLCEVDSMARTNLGENYLMKGDPQKAREFLEAVMENVDNPDYWLARPRWKPRCLLVLAELWFSQGDSETANSYLRKLDDHGFVERFPFRKYQVRVGRLRGMMHSAQGRYDEAEAEMKQALQRAQSLGNPYQQWNTHQAMGNLLIATGKVKLAEKQFRSALEVVQEVADGLTDSELKVGFLKSEPIRQVFAQADAI